jgi:hypothetical protein
MGVYCRSSIKLTTHRFLLYNRPTARFNLLNFELQAYVIVYSDLVEMAAVISVLEGDRQILVGRGRFLI